MAQLIDYPAWLLKVNAELGNLTNNILSAEDFDYPWIESFMANMEADAAARQALEADGFIIEKLPAPIMLLKGVTHEPRC
ncbi:MAG: hypothetical protein DPW09_45625 [Anaerolineae bacterium]|nr:hypothetical protein [Anaerolineae bacterium]